MSESYWQSVVSAGMHVPADRPLDESTMELVEMLGSPNPRLRDDLAYPLLATWISQGEYDHVLTGLGNGIAPGLRTGLGGDGDVSVLRRSFSALLLAEIVSRDNNEALVPPDTVMSWGDLATSWYVRERDLRGWIPGQGRALAVAHGADLLGALARSRHFKRLELTVLLDVTADRLLTPTTHAWRHGEEDRLAYATMAVLQRGELAFGVLEPWLARVAEGTRPPRTRGSVVGEWPTVSAHNTSAYLRSLHIQLALGVQGRPGQRDDADLFRGRPPHRSDLLLVVLDAIRAESPWLFQSSTGRRTFPSAT
ncbi:DUF2785 domain-containing protein [Solicola sp. PLA-1-18]|uniref:DUF2785 domain-containing protein n=1 Tax=Solicola sp. PLA-1-18 TaxID=3380532 RepID=UPI003B7B7457